MIPSKKRIGLDLNDFNEIKAESINNHYIYYKYYRFTHFTCYFMRKI